MALLAYAGTIIKSGDPQNITIGFTPTTVFLWTPNAQAENSWSNQLDLGYGFWSQPAGGAAVRQQAMWIWSNNAVSTSSAQAGLNPSRAIATKGWSLTVTAITNGLKFNWGSSPPSNTRVHFIALGGDAQSNILALTLTSALTAGQTVPVRGLGFQPTAVLALAQRDASAADKTIGFGAADTSGGQWATGAASQNGVNPPNTARAWREDSLIVLPDGSGAATSFRAHLARVVPPLAGIAGETGGFDLVIDTPPTANITVYFLGIRGMMTRATAQAKTTGAAPATGTVTSGFRPLADLFVSTYQTGTGIATQNRGMIGASDGTNQAVGAWSDQDGISPSVAKGISRTDVAVIKADNGTPTIEGAATAALTATGATLTWNPNDAVASRYGTLAFGTLKNELGGTSTTNADLSADVFWQPILLLPNPSTTETDATGAVGPAAVLGGTSTTEDDASANLRADTNFYNPQTTTETDFTGRLALHALLSGSTETTDYTYVSGFGKGVDLSGPNVSTTETDLTGKLSRSELLVGTSTTENDAAGYFLLNLPEVLPTEPGEIAGTVNWHPNPSAEGSLLGWDAFGGASISLDTNDAWDGTFSALVTTNNSAAGQGVLIRASAGLQLTGKARTVWSQVRCKGPAGTVLQTWSQIVYVDGTTVVGDIGTVTLTGNWDLIYAPATQTIPSLVLLQAEMALVTSTPAALSFRVDGAQIEEDHGDGPTRIALGGYSEEIGVWQGIPHRSVTLRQPLIREVKAPGRGGNWVIESFLYRATWDNQWVEDISDGILSGSVTMDATRDVVWTFDATLTLDGWRKLTPFLDWVAPYLRVTAPDGSIREGQLGLYFVVDSPETRNEIGGTVRLQCGDPLWFLQKQAFIGNFIARAGVEKMHAVRDIINGAVLTGLGAQPTMDKRYAIPDSGALFKKQREVTRKTTRLDCCNQISRSAGFYPLYTTGTGIMLTRRMGGDNEKRLRHRQAVREWTANVPPGWTNDGWIPKIYDGPSELVGSIDTTPKMNDMANEIWLINDDPDDNKIFVQHRIRHHKNKRSLYIDAGRHGHKKVYAPFMDDQATAEEVAAALADELSTRNTTIAFSVLPDPSLSLMHEVVNLAFFDNSADNIAGGKYAVHRVEYGFTPNDCLMKINAGLVQIADDKVEQDAA